MANQHVTYRVVERRDGTVSTGWLSSLRTRIDRAPEQTTVTPLGELDDSELRDLVSQRAWYHTLELRPGVVTPGWFDLRRLAQELPIPTRLDGCRALDVGTFEGFWALQLEARGADVTAIDILDPHAWDWPYGSDEHIVSVLEERKQSGSGFELVVEALQSSVKRIEMSVYDLDPDVVGRFDFVYLGSLLLHLRDPIRALEQVRSVLAPGGQLLLVDAIDVDLTVMHPRRAVAHFDGDGRPWWWRPNLAALSRMVTAAGFEVIDGPTRVFMPLGAGHDPLVRPRPRALLDPEGRRQLVMRLRHGDPHAWVLARPR
jgi:tRNA (mo5U34)-methyltransferase